MGMKYEYLLYTWGGFYNEYNKGIHKEQEGYHYFDTEEERSKYIHKLKAIEKDTNALYLMTHLAEGYYVRTIPMLHRVIRYKGKEYYSYDTRLPGTPYYAMKYNLENKWYPGCNDYPLGEDFEHYDDVETVQEWITGAFDINDSH